LFMPTAIVRFEASRAAYNVLARAKVASTGFVC
jgi:hypothetical protein